MINTSIKSWKKLEKNQDRYKKLGLLQINLIEKESIIHQKKMNRKNLKKCNLKICLNVLYVKKETCVPVYVQKTQSSKKIYSFNNF